MMDIVFYEDFDTALPIHRKVLAKAPKWQVIPKVRAPVRIVAHGVARERPFRVTLAPSMLVTDDPIAVDGHALGQRCFVDRRCPRSSCVRPILEPAGLEQPN